MFPITIENPAYYKDSSQMYYIPVPCRKCPTCLQARTNNWVFKLMQEDKTHALSYFVTLTMDNEYMNAVKGKKTKRKDSTYTNITPNGFMSLRKQDVQLFIKRLRKNISKTHNNVIKYYAVGEYGGTTFRPHYHLIIFGANVMDIEQAWSLNGKLIGHVTCDQVNGATIAYTAKYMNKGKIIPVHANDDRLPEFQLSSQKMGLNYITPQIIRYHNADITRNYVTLDGGVKLAMPTAYRQKIYDEKTRKAQARNIQKMILEKEEKDQEEFARQYGSSDNYYRVRNESKLAALKVFRERLKQRNKI